MCRLQVTAPLPRLCPVTTFAHITPVLPTTTRLCHYAYTYKFSHCQFYNSWCLFPCGTGVPSALLYTIALRHADCACASVGNSGSKQPGGGRAVPDGVATDVANLFVVPGLPYCSPPVVGCDQWLARSQPLAAYTDIFTSRSTPAALPADTPRGTFFAVATGRVVERWRFASATPSDAGPNRGAPPEAIRQLDTRTNAYLYMPRRKTPDAFTHHRARRLLPATACRTGACLTHCHADSSPHTTFFYRPIPVCFLGVRTCGMPSDGVLRHAAP